MRSACFALLLANVAFFGWAHWIDAHAVVNTPAPARRLPLLELASLPDPATVLCRSLGPFPDPALAAAAADALRRRGVQAHERSVEATVTDGFWVHIDVPETVERRVLARLGAAGLRDAVALPQSSAVARISTGVFANQADAVHRAEQVRALGFKPVLELHQRAGQVRWLDMYLPRGTAEPAVGDLVGTAAPMLQPPQFADCGTRAGGDAG